MNRLKKSIVVLAGIVSLFSLGNSAQGAQRPGEAGPLMVAISDDITPYLEHKGSDNSPLIVVKSGIGPYLTDGKGMTLYYCQKDAPARDACTGDCRSQWPTYYVDKLVPPGGSDPEDFGSFTRKDGVKQTTFKGWPVYYFAGDKKPGDTNGQDKNNLWHVMDPIALSSCK